MNRRELAIALTCKLNHLRKGSVEHPSYVARYHRIMAVIYRGGGRVLDHGRYSEAVL